MRDRFPAKSLRGRMPALKSSVYKLKIKSLILLTQNYTGFQKHLDDDSPAFQGLEWVEDLRDRHKALENKFIMGLGCGEFILGLTLRGRHLGFVAMSRCTILSILYLIIAFAFNIMIIGVPL